MQVDVISHAAHEACGWREAAAPNLSPGRSGPDPRVPQERPTPVRLSTKKQYRAQARIPGDRRARPRWGRDRRMRLRPLMVRPEPGLGAEVQENDLLVIRVEGKNGKQAKERHAGRSWRTTRVGTRRGRPAGP